MGANEQITKGAPKVAQLNLDARAEVASVVGVLGQSVADGRSPVLEPLVRDNSILALAADHGQVVLAKVGTRVSGSPGATVAKATLRGTDVSTFDGVRFLNAAAAALVVMENAAGTAVFTNCRFSKAAGVGGNYVEIVAGARAHFIGCVFDGVQPAGNTVNNAGLAANVFVVGCSRKTTTAHLNVTVIAETT